MGLGDFGSALVNYGKSFGSNFKDFLKTNKEALDALGTLASGIGAIYGGYQNAQAAKRANDLNYEYMQNEIKRRNKANKELKKAWADSGLGTYEDSENGTI